MSECNVDGNRCESANEMGNLKAEANGESESESEADKCLLHPFQSLNRFNEPFSNTQPILHALTYNDADGSVGQLCANGE